LHAWLGFEFFVCKTQEVVIISGRKIVLLAFNVPEKHQEEMVQLIAFTVQTTFEYATPIASAYGRPHRAVYWLSRKLVSKGFMSQADFYGMAAREALEFYGLLPHWDERKEKQKASEE
jgi:hypothetical protein